MTVSRRQFIAGAVGAVAASKVAGQKAKTAAARPNIIFILADDLGWGDLSCYGRPDFQTPYLDKLATEGIKFTHAYSAAPVCTPTRVGFHTGRYPARLPVGLEEPLWERSGIDEERLKKLGIPLEHPTVSSLIKAAGYSTALIGKWHLGYLPYFSPLKQGFDEFFGNMSGAVDHFTHRDMTDTADFFEGETPVEKIGYMTDLLSERAVEYVSRKHERPFYLSLHYTAPHWPWEGPTDRAVSESMKYSSAGFRSGGSMKIYADMVRNMDEGIGHVLDALRKAGREKNTLVIFTSDNGGERFSFNWPFRGQKQDVYEGGVRVPAIVRWPGVQSKPRTTDQPVITMDWTATMLAAAGTKPDPKYSLDGDDMTSTLAGTRATYSRDFYWRTKRQGAVRSGNRKYVHDGKNEFLYDLKVDESEHADFSGKETATLERLRRLYDRWESQMEKYSG